MYDKTREARKSNGIHEKNSFFYIFYRTNFGEVADRFFKTVANRGKLW